MHPDMAYSSHMILIEYLRQNDLTMARFAELIGVSTSAAQRYAARERIPRATIMRRIVEATDGAVQPQDFYGTDPDGEAA